MKVPAHRGMLRLLQFPTAFLCLPWWNQSALAQVPPMPVCSSSAAVNAAPPATTVPGLAGGPVSLTVVGQTGGATQAVALQRSYAYVGVGKQLVVLDVSNPSAPLPIGVSDPLGGDVLDIAIAGSLAYVAAGGAGLVLMDISNPATPGIVGAYHAPGFAEGVAVKDGYAYVADGPGGLRVVNVTNPANPAEAAVAFSLNYVFGVTLAGTQAYLAAAGAGLLVADVSNPASPVEIARMNTPGYAYGIAASGQTVYVADGWAGLHVFDVADPFHPKDMGSSQTPGWAMSAAVSGSMLYIADAGAGIRVMDISRATAPRDLGGLQFPQGHAQRLAVSGSHVYVADRKAGLHVVDATTPAQPVQVGSYSPLGFAAGVAVAGNYAYVGGFLADGLRVIDVSSPTHPHEVGAFPFDSNDPMVGTVVTAANGFVQVSTGHGVYTVDVSDPAHPKGSVHGYPFGTARNQVVHGGVLIQTNEWGLRLINISDPSSPCELNFMNFRVGDKGGGGANDYGDPGSQSATGVAVSGNLAYVAGGNLWVVDISDPRNPAKVGEYDDPGVGQPPQPPAFNDVTLAGNLVYAIGQSNAGTIIRIVDITDPKRPRARGFLVVPPSPGGWGPSMALAGNILYVADGGAGLLAVDVRNPDQPSLAGRLSLSGNAWSVVADSRYVYAGAEDGGLVVVQATQSSVSPPAAKTEENRTAVPDSTVPRAFFVRARPHAYRVPGNLPPVPPRPIAQALGNTCTVTSPADSGSGTMRQCLQQAAAGGVITFDPSVFPPKSPVAIKFLSAPPPLLAGGLTIDASDAGVVLDGSGAPPGADGLLIRSNGNLIRGLQITGFGGNGIDMQGASDNVVGGDRSHGTGPSGQGNVINGNGASGIQLSGGPPYDPVCGCGGTGNRIIGNYIGLDVTGAKALGNVIDGITIKSDGTTIGGATPAERNTISGNRTSDVKISGANTRNTIIGNYIGTDAAGRVSLSNGGYWSVALEGGAWSNRVVGNVVVGGHQQAGIALSDNGASYNEVIGNYIGLDASGTVALGNGASIAVFQPFNKIGGKTPQERNVIRAAVSVTGTSDNVILGNFVAMDATSSRVVGSGFAGVQLQGRHNFVGGPGDGERNVLAGSVVFAAGSTGNFIGGNYFGTDVTGTVALASPFVGIHLDTAESNAIQGNRIVGSGYGITLDTGANGNWVRANRILQNPGAGIQVRGARNRIEGNALLSNRPNAADAGLSNLWDNGRTGNYWSDYTGKDANGDGVGDTPYTIAANGVDRYPLMSDPAKSPASLVLSQSQLSFSFVVGGPAPATQSVAIGNSANAALSWTAASNAAWLSVSPVSGPAPAAISVSVNPANLAAGTYIGSLAIASTAANSPATIRVSLTVTVPPPPSITSVFNAASLQPGVSSSAWVSILGANLSATTRIWTSADFIGALLPTSLDGVDVKINGRAAFVYYISPTQINVLAPDDPTKGPVPVQVSNSAGKSNSLTADKRDVSPALFTFVPAYAAAVHADGVYVGKLGLLPGAVTRPAQPGETIVLFGTGFGPTDPALPAGQVITQAASLVNPVTVRIGNIVANVAFAGLTGSGLCQFNVTVPDLPDGDASMVAEIGGVRTQDGVYITIQR